MHISSRCAGPTVAAFGHRQRRCDDMLAAVFRKLLSGECTTRYDHGRWHVCSGHLSQGCCVTRGSLGSASACEFYVIFLY